MWQNSTWQDVTFQYHNIYSEYNQHLSLTTNMSANVNRHTTRTSANTEENTAISIRPSFFGDWEFSEVFRKPTSRRKLGKSVHPDYSRLSRYKELYIEDSRWSQNSGSCLRIWEEEARVNTTLSNANISRIYPISPKNAEARDKSVTGWTPSITTSSNSNSPRSSISLPDARITF